jgi:hypothetical protein
MCKRKAKLVLKRRDQCAPTRECWLRTPATRSGRREADGPSSGRFSLPKRRHLRVGPSVGQRGKRGRQSRCTGPWGSTPSPAFAVKALWETLRRPSGAGTHSASFAAALQSGRRSGHKAAWAFPSYMLKFDFSLLFFIFFGCSQFSLTLTTMIAYCPHKASGEGGLVQI